MSANRTSSGWRRARAAPSAATSEPATQRKTRRGGSAPARRISGEERRRMIAEAAYLLAERRGFAPGREAEDWYEAEAAVDARLASLGIAVED